MSKQSKYYCVGGNEDVYCIDEIPDDIKIVDFTNLYILRRVKRARDILGLRIKRTDKILVETINGWVIALGDGTHPIEK